MNNSYNLRGSRYIISTHDLFPVILEELKECRQASFTITGMSMWPFFCHGRDTVVIEQYPSLLTPLLKIGDIVLICTPSRHYILHRVTKISKDGRYIETTGDGNCYRDSPVPVSYVKARVVKFIRKGKSIDCHSYIWRVVFRIWMLLFPFRPCLLPLLKRVSAIKSKLIIFRKITHNLGIASKL